MLYPIELCGRFYLRLCYLIHCQCLTFPQVITPLELWLSHSLLIPSHLWQAVRFCLNCVEMK
ncbi:hypothetical protein F9837_10770 [Glaesserella parasuis]|nr:hypothetical protein [Glaesserella parasuis]